MPGGKPSQGPVRLCICRCPLRQPELRPFFYHTERRSPAPEQSSLSRTTNRFGTLRSKIIRDLGYETLTASNGQEALKLLRQTDVVDLLFTDLVMPGPLMGLALAREAQIMRPGLPVLLATDYASLDEQAENEFPVIAKPFRAAELSRVIARLILNKPPEADRNR